ncbi:hypothetical protein Avbf_08892 [Armadillidium vulgare]|nr:hypothetical protein Avbf_08892 [Armadillidium vulgare]
MLLKVNNSSFCKNIYSLFSSKYNQKYAIRIQFSTDVLEKDIHKKSTKYKKTILFPTTSFPVHLKGKKRVKADQNINETSNFEVKIHQTREKNILLPLLCMMDLHMLMENFT